MKKTDLKRLEKALEHYDKVVQLLVQAGESIWKQASNIHVKVNGTWQKVAKVWKKVSGSWVLQPDKSSLFSQDVSYINGDNL